MKKPSYATLKADPRYLNININGNKKLRNTDKVRFIIWNIPSIVTCPYRTALCEKNCYAKKAEAVYPDVLPSREKNFVASRSDNFVDNMIFTLEAELSTKKYEGKKVIVRIHESGDFYNKAYTDKWLDIARHFVSNKNVIFQAYTKSLVYFKGVELPVNFRLISSIWDDTKAEAIQETINNNYTSYSAVPKFDNNNSCETIEEHIKAGLPFRCRCEDCANCGACSDFRVKSIVCEIH